MPEYKRPKMGGKEQNVPQAPRVPDPLAGNYDAVKPVTELQGRATKITEQTHGTSASMQNTKAPNMAMPVLGQPVKVSSKDFKKNVKISSATHGLV